MAKGNNKTQRSREAYEVLNNQGAAYAVRQGNSGVELINGMALVYDNPRANTPEAKVIHSGATIYVINEQNKQSHEYWEANGREGNEPSYEALDASVLNAATINYQNLQQVADIRNNIARDNYLNIKLSEAQEVSTGKYLPPSTSDKVKQAIADKKDVKVNNLQEDAYKNIAKYFYDFFENEGAAHKIGQMILRNRLNSLESDL